MAAWEILYVNPIGNGRYHVIYLLHGKERRRAIVSDFSGLEYALTEMGKHLSSRLPLNRPNVGIGKQ